MDAYQSWGSYPQAKNQNVVTVAWRPARLPLPADPATTVLPYGLGRSQGDSCLNDGGSLLATSRLDRFISFDETTGRLRCEAGVTLADIVEQFAPRGWFLPVTPGTKYVTVGGAIANDVHGKNHIRAGTFGCHIHQFELLRSDGKAYLCSPLSHPNLFAATIGGLGLTGLITWAELSLKRVPTEYVATETRSFNSIAEWFTQARQAEADFEYSIGQCNGIMNSAAFGRGVLMLGNHATDVSVAAPRSSRTLTVPITAPNWLLNDASMRLYTWWYQHRARRSPTQRVQHYDPYFYPLDSIHHWNRLYGPRGFLQYQVVFPLDQAVASLEKIMALMRRHRLSSYLVSLKLFGERTSPGLLSFPRAGAAMALDFPMRGERTLSFLRDCDKVTNAGGGRVYPAKDSRLSATDFKQQYPHWRQLQEYSDPRFSSSFWRRVVQ